MRCVSYGFLIIVQVLLFLTFRFSPPRWLDTFPYRWRATSRSQRGVTWQPKQNKKHTPHRAPSCTFSAEFPKLSVWMERIIRRFVKTRSICSRGAGKICRRSPLACSSRDRGFHCFPVGMCGRDGKGWASLLHYNRVASIMPPFSLSVWPTGLVYWFNLLLLLIIHFPSSPSIVRNRTTGLWRTDFS